MSTGYAESAVGSNRLTGTNRAFRVFGIHRVTNNRDELIRFMTESTSTGGVRGASERVYGMVLRATAAVVVLLIFAGLAYLVDKGRVDGGALLMYAGVILGYVLSAAWHRR